MKKLAVCLFVLTGVLVILVMLVTSIEVFALNPGFYQAEYLKLKQSEVIGISGEDLNAVTQNLLDYTTGKRENLDMQYTIQGQMREVFNDREKSHMVDVRALYLSARDVRNIAAVLAIVLLIAGLMLYKKGAVRAALGTYVKVCGVFFVIIAALGLYAALDFYSFWTNFHLLFFSNDLWLLDPATDVLIMMVPGQFFFDLVTRILIAFASVFAASVIASAIARALLKRREGRTA